MKNLRNTSVAILFAFAAHSACAAVETPANPVMPPETVLASNAMVTVTYRDLLAELVRIPVKDQHEFLMNRQRLGTVVENILINKTLAHQARTSGLDRRDDVAAEIQNQADKVLAKYQGQAIQEAAPKLDHTAKARELYLSHPERWVKQAYYKVWHAFISYNGRTKESALARAKELYEKTKGAKSLEDLALEYSEDSLAHRNKGTTDILPASSFEGPYLNALKSLKVGEFSPLVETPTGIFVIKLLKTVPESKVPFDLAKVDLLVEAEMTYLSTYWEGKIQAIRGDKAIKVNIDALEALRPKLPDASLITPPAPAAVK